MTAEEYAKEEVKQFPAWDYFGKNEIQDLIKEAFNKGKQEAEMGFAEWCSINQWEIITSGENKGKWRNWYPQGFKTSEELYKMYLKWLEENGK